LWQSPWPSAAVCRLHSVIVCSCAAPAAP